MRHVSAWADIDLGALVRDRVTGFKGVVTAETRWLNGCVRYGVQARELKDGVPMEAQWFDHGDLEVVAPDAFKDPEPPGAATGGPPARGPETG